MVIWWNVQWKSWRQQYFMPFPFTSFFSLCCLWMYIRDVGRQSREKSQNVIKLCDLFVEKPLIVTTASFFAIKTVFKRIIIPVKQCYFSLSSSTYYGVDVTITFTFPLCLTDLYLFWLILMAKLIRIVSLKFKRKKITTKSTLKEVKKLIKFTFYDYVTETHWTRK